MPKNLENIREKIIEEAMHQVFEKGYGETTIRTIAKGCGIAVGTIYNYFESKDYLLADFLMRDWKNSMEQIQEKCRRANSYVEACQGIYEELLAYDAKYDKLFKDPAAVKDAAGFIATYHKNLRSALAGLVEQALERLGLEADEQRQFLSEFTAEALLTWSTEGAPFDKISPILMKLVQ